MNIYVCYMHLHLRSLQDKSMKKAVNPATILTTHIHSYLTKLESPFCYFTVNIYSGHYHLNK